MKPPKKFKSITHNPNSKPGKITENSDNIEWPAPFPFDDSDSVSEIITTIDAQPVIPQQAPIIVQQPVNQSNGNSFWTDLLKMFSGAFLTYGVYRAKKSYDTEKRKEMEDYKYQKKREEEERNARINAALKLNEPANSIASESIDDLFSNQEKSCIPSYNICGPIKAGQTVLIYGSTGCGKSIAANQIAISINEGTDCTLFPKENRICKKQHVFVFDAELSEDDLSKRGIGKRVERAIGYTGYTSDKFFVHIDKLIDRVNEDMVAIVDNVTVGIPDFTQWQSTSALSKINNLKKKANDKGIFLTLIFVAHSDNAKSFNLNNMKGYKTLQDIANLVFEIEPTGFDSNRKCMKMMKNRGGSLEQNAYLLQISTYDYLHFEFENIIEEDKVFSTDIPKGSLGDEDDELIILLKKHNSQNIIRDLHMLMLIREYAQNEDMTEAEKDEAIVKIFQKDDESLGLTSIRRWKTRMKEAGLIPDGRSKKKK